MEVELGSESVSHLLEMRGRVCSGDEISEEDGAEEGRKDRRWKAQSVCCRCVGSPIFPDLSFFFFFSFSSPPLCHPMPSDSSPFLLPYERNDA